MNTKPIPLSDDPVIRHLQDELTDQRAKLESVEADNREAIELGDRARRAVEAQAQKCTSLEAAIVVLEKHRTSTATEGLS